MGRSQVEYNRSHRNRGSKGRGGGAGRGNTKGRGRFGGGRPTTDQPTPIGDNSFRYEQNPYDDEGDDDDTENIMGKEDMNSTGHNVNQYGPSHDAISVRSEQRIDNNFDGYDEAKHGGGSDGIYAAGGDLANALSALPAHIWMKLPKHIGKRVDLSLGRNVDSTAKRVVPKKEDGKPSNEKVILVEKEEEKTDEVDIVQTVIETVDTTEGEANTKTGMSSERGEDTNDIGGGDDDDDDDGKTEGKDGNDDGEEEMEEDLDAWLDSVIS